MYIRRSRSNERWNGEISRSDELLKKMQLLNQRNDEELLKNL